VARGRGLNLARGQRTARRRGEWDRGPGTGTLLNLSTSSIGILGSGVLFTEGGQTVVRLRGHLQAFLKTASAGDEGFHCAVGVGVVTADAFSIGITAVPDPIGDIAWGGWMFHQFFDLFAPSGTIADSFGGGPVIADFDVDSKAMRKIGINETLFAVVEVVEAGTATMSIRFDSRVYIKLS